MLRQVRRCVDAGALRGDEVDLAQVLVALVHGLATAEMTGRLGRDETALRRRWDLAVRALIDGLGTGASG
nr:TetR-like C-terminal domain-containing protein [Cryptosporangium aurantiacum]